MPRSYASRIVGCGTSSEKELSYGLQFHADQDVSEVTPYWGEVVQIDPGSIRLQRKSNSSQLLHRTWRCRYGVLAVTANDTLLRARLQAWMDCLRHCWA